MFTKTIVMIFAGLSDAVFLYDWRSCCPNSRTYAMMVMTMMMMISMCVT